ncbi:mycothione reductase [Intrasporangium oryzae NRRL B-24470]|uniref:Mycothione reductase n=1 Tax=Intrasporangium oryzae NRRL B-24470 TaxID=1386089 RepID=W9G7P3_9MICO|nr:mycothione reductase [Intrasporangium oryzae]EWT00843.1 mycothione reductase [Intrasporangium oryzae NRRL B-24470]
MTEHYDLAIIGTGSGNSLVTPDFDDRRVAVIESGTFGGTCLNVGCIPTKMFVYAAEVADGIRSAARYGVDATVDGVRWADIRDRIFGRIDPIAESGKRWRVDGPNTTAYLGRARFTGDRRLTVDLNDGGTALLAADQVVVATGAHPMVPDVVTESGVPFHTSDTIMRIDEVPERLLIIGGGFIAVEMAHVFSSLGSRVTILARGDLLLRHLDTEIARRFTDVARGRWDVRTMATARSLTEQDGTIRADLLGGGSAEGDLLLVATGRHPNTAGIGLELAGVDLHPDGRIVVDEHGRTTASGVWSLGDVSSPYQLKHVANAEARVVAHNLVHPDDLRSFPHEHVPSGVFSHPQVATIGLTEQQCVARGLRHVTKVQAYGDTAYGWAMEDTTSVCKVIADPATGLLLGAHVLGPDATTLIQPLIQAISIGTPAHTVARGQYWIHPALAEVVENALLGLDLDQP